MTAGEVKFSEAISWRPVFWRSTSRSIDGEQLGVGIGGPGHRGSFAVVGRCGWASGGRGSAARRSGRARRAWRRGRRGGHPRTRRLEPGVDGVHRDLDADEALTQADDVGVVVLTGQAGRGHVVDRGGPHAGDLVGRHADADARPAHGDAELAPRPRRPLARPRRRSRGSRRGRSSGCRGRRPRCPGSTRCSASSSLSPNPAWSDPTATVLGRLGVVGADGWSVTSTS